MARFQYLSRSTVRSVLPGERATDEFKAKLEKLDKSIANKAGDPATVVEIEAIEASFLSYGDRANAEFSSAVKSPDPVKPESKMPN